MPDGRLLTARPRLRSPDMDFEYQQWSYNALAAAARSNPGCCRGEDMALTLLDLARSLGCWMPPRPNWRERTGGGMAVAMGGALREDFAAPVDLNGPE